MGDSIHLTTEQSDLFPTRHSGEIRFSPAQSVAVLEPKIWRDAFTEAADNPSHYIPYWGMVGDTRESWQQFKAARAVQSGTATQEQSDLLNAFLADRQRDQTFGYKAWSIALDSVPFMLEFLGGGKLIKSGAQGIVKTGLKAAGSMSDDAIEILMRKVAAGTAERGALQAALRAVPKQSAGLKVAAYFADDTLGAFGRAASEWSSARMAGAATPGMVQAMKSTAGPALGKAAAEGVLRTGLQPHRVTNQMIQNMTPQYALTEDAQGNLARVLADEGDGFLPAFAKAFGDVAIENFSEQTGESFLVLKGMFGPAAKQFLKGSIIKSYADKAIAAMVAKGIPADKATKIAAEHLLGKAGDPGLIQKMGWHGVMAEMGEEGIGGLLRQATGISEPGLPELEDVAAMAVGFAFNPMAMGSFVADSGARQYAERVSGLKTALDKAKAPGGAIRSAEDVEDLRNQLIKMAEYKQTEPKGMMQRFARAMFLDRVWDAQADLLRREGGEERMVDSDTGKAIMRRVEWEMDTILSQKEKIAPEDIDKLLMMMLDTRIISKNEYDAYADILSKQGEVLNRDDVNSQVAVAINAGDYAPYIAIDTGTLSEVDSRYLHENMPWVIQTLRVGESQFAIKTMNSENSFPEVNEGNVVDVATLYGVPSVHVERRGRGASMIVKNKKQLVEEVKRDIAWKRDLWKSMQQGTNLILTPFGVVQGTLAEFNAAGQPVNAEKATNGVLRYAVGAHYNRNNKTLEFNQYSSKSDLAEDAIHDFLTEEDGTLAPEVNEFGDAIRASLPEGHPYKNDPRINEELVAKAMAVELGWGPTSKNDLKNIIIDNGILLPSDVWSWADNRAKAAATNAKGGNLLEFLRKSAKDHGEAVERPQEQEDAESASEAAEAFRVETRAHTKAKAKKAAEAPRTTPDAPVLDEVPAEPAERAEAPKPPATPEASETPAVSDEAPPPPAARESETPPTPLEAEQPLFTEEDIKAMNDLGLGREISLDDVAHLFGEQDGTDLEDYPDSEEQQYSLREFSVRKGRHGDASGVAGSSENAFNKMVNEFKSIREFLDDRFPNEQDVGHWALYNYANGLKQPHAKMDDLIKMLESRAPTKMQRMKAIYRSVIPIGYRRAEISPKGVNLWMSNRDWEKGKKPGPTKWYFHNVEGKGRPGYLGSMHATRILNELGYDYEVFDGVKDTRDWKNPVTATAGDISDETMNTIRDGLYERSYNRDQKHASKDEGYWHVMTKLGDKDLTFLVWMNKYESRDMKIKAGKAYRKAYESMDPAVAEEFFIHPDKLRAMTGRQFADAVNHFALIRKMVGDVAAFKNVDDFGKRMSQSGTPGVRLEADRPIRYAVFEDSDLFDGMAFYTRDGFGQLADSHLGTKNSDVIKMFAFFRNMGGEGSVHSYKPLAVNVEQLDSHPRYAGIAKWMKDNGIDLLIPSSSVKLGKSDAVADPVKMTDLLDHEGEDVTIRSDATAEIMEMEAQDIIVSGDYNYSTEFEVKTFLKQMQSILTHYNGPELQQWREYMNKIADAHADDLDQLTLSDIIPHEDPKDDDPAMYGKMQAALRAGIPDNVILSIEGELGYQKITSAINSRLAEPVTRLLKSSVAPGYKSGFEKGDRKPSRMAPDGIHIIPGDLDTNIKGGVYTEDNAEGYWYNTHEDALRALQAHAKSLSRSHPWMYEVSPVTGKVDVENPIIRDYLVVPWEKNGREGFTLSGEIVIASRVPASGVAFTVPAILNRRIGDGNASLAMSDAITQSAKGEDNDADQVFLDLIPRFGNETIQKRAHLLLLQAMMKHTPERLKYMTAEMDIELLKDYIPEKSKRPPLNSDEGQAHLRNLMGEWNKALGIAASTSPTLRFWNEQGVASEDMIILDEAQGLVVSRFRDHVAALTPEGKLVQDHVWGNFLINFFVDAPKHGKLYDSGLNRYTTPLLYAIGSGSIRIQDEAALIDYAGRAMTWLRENEAVQSYVSLKENGATMAEIFGNEETEAMIRGDEVDIKNLRKLLDWSSKLFDSSQAFNMSYSWPGNPEGFMRGHQKVNSQKISEGIVNVEPLSRSPFHYRTRLKQKALDYAWADSPFMRQMFGFKGRPPTQDGVRRMKSMVTLEAVNIMRPNNYSRDAVASRLVEAKAAHADNAFMQAFEIQDRIQNTRTGQKKGSFTYKVGLIARNFRGTHGQLPRADVEAGFAELPLDVKIDLIAMNAITAGTPGVTSGSEWGGDYSTFIDMETYGELGQRMYEAGQAFYDVENVTEDMQAFVRGRRYTEGKTGWADHVPVSSESETPVNVWHGTGENAVLSNLASRPFVDKNGRSYLSVEHAYQSWKSGAFDKATYDKYTKAGGKIVGNLGTKTEGNWNVTLMEQLMRASFEQNPDSMKALRATGDATITHTQDRGIWKTEFPRILMDIRGSVSAPSYSLTWFNAASQEGWKRGEATFYNRAEVQDFAKQYDDYWRPIMLRLRDAVNTDAFIEKNFVPYPEGDYPPRMSPTPGLIAKARQLAYRENLDRQVREFNEPEAQLSFAYSLSALHPDTLQTHPQYVTSGWKVLHNEWVRVRNLMRGERLNGRLTSEALVRLAGGAKMIGWGMRQIETGENAGKYKLVDFDRKDPKAPLGFHEDAGVMKFWDADRQVTARNKGIPKPTDQEKARAHEVLRAVTAVKEDPGATEYSQGTVKDKDGHPIRDRFYVVDLLNGTKRVVADNHGYKTEAEAHADRVKLTGHPGRFIIEKGYRQKFGSVADAVAIVGQKKFDEMVNISRGAMHRARNMANMAAREVLDGVEMIPEFGKKGKTYMPHLYVRRELTEEEKEAFEDQPEALFEDEDTKRGRKRTYPRFIDAAALRGLEPLGQGNAATLIDSWYDDVWHRTVTRVAVTLGSTSRDYDGSPMWIPVFHTSDEAKSHVSIMTKKQQLVALEHAVDYVNMLRSQRGEELFLINHKADPADEMERMFKESTELIKQEYEPVESTRTTSVAMWWVKKRDKDRPEFLFSTGPRKMLEKLEGMPKELTVGRLNFGEAINRFNAWSKFSGLSLSAFHPASLLESMVAFGGFTVKNVQNLLLGKKTFRDIQKQLKMAKANPEIGAKWAAKGMMLDVTNPNIAEVLRPKKSATDVISRDIEAMKDVTGLRHVAPYIEKYHDWINHWLWGTYYPAIKLYAAETALVEIRKNYALRGLPLDEDNLMREISKMMNDGFGGQNWDQYIWATPRMQQLLHMTMFAPDWTLSAFNIAGASNIPGIKNMIREDQGPIQKDWAARRYWPGMVALVMLGIPQAVQAAIYAMSRMLPGDDDPEDTPFLALNEQGKSGIAGIGGHIDMTPLLRKFGWVPVTGYEGGRTGERRVYLRFAKQATEVFEGWATRPWQTFKNKTSAAVRTAYEQITGTNTAGWDMRFGDGISGVVTGERGVVDSRAVSVIKKFVPMSILSIIEGRPTTFFAPASRGMSLYKAQLEYAKVLKAYGDSRVMDKVNASQKYKTNLKALDMAILDAAQRNGINPEDVVNGAKRTVLSSYYGDFFDALNKQKLKKLETIADKIIRVNGSADGALRSMKHRFQGTNRELTPELESLATQAFE